MEMDEIVKLGSLLASGLVGYGVLQGKVKSLAERLTRVETQIDAAENRIQDHSVSMAEMQADMKHVVSSLAIIEQKLDMIIREKSA
jgi:hypothetical protein